MDRTGWAMDPRRPRSIRNLATSTRVTGNTAAGSRGSSRPSRPALRGPRWRPSRISPSRSASRSPTTSGPSRPSRKRTSPPIWRGSDPSEAPPQGGGVQGGALGGAQKPTPTIPIEVALRLMTEPAPSVAPMGSVPPASGEGRGAALYAERCASCHGASGEGGVRVRMLGSALYAYVTTLPLSANRTGWMGGGGRFERLVLEGIPGYLMPGNGDLSSEDVRALYDFATSMRSRQGSTPPGSPAAQAPATPAPRAASSARRPGGATRS